MDDKKRRKQQKLLPNVNREYISIEVKRVGPIFVRFKFVQNRFEVDGFDRSCDGESGEIEICGAISKGDILISLNNCSLIGKSFQWINEYIIGSCIKEENRVFVFEKHNSIKSITTKLSVNERITNFNSILSHKIINEGKIRCLAADGIPSELRGIIWRVLLRYLPREVDKWEMFLMNRRDEYKSLISQYYYPISTLSSDIKDSMLISEIEKDVIRTHPDNHFFIDNTAVHETLKRILFIFSKVSSGIGVCEYF
jgi:hypothetical protein